MSAVPPAPNFAICLAAFNGTPWLDEQVASILAQEDVAVTLWASVDASQDGTEAWFDQAAARDARIRLLPHGQRFGGAAPNFFRLLREADFSTCDYIALADQDDLWHPDKLRRAVEQMHTHRADAYSSNVVAFWPDGRTAHLHKAQAQRPWDHLFEAAGPGCTYVMRRTLALAMQAALRAAPAATAGIRFHDWFAYAFARTHGHTWHIDDRPGLRYRQHLQNELGAHRGWRALRHRAGLLFGGDHLDQARRIAQASGAVHLPAVRNTLFGGRAGLLRLALQAGACRRRRRDQVAFALACLWLALRGDAK